MADARAVDAETLVAAPQSDDVDVASRSPQSDALASPAFSSWSARVSFAPDACLATVFHDDSLGLLQSVEEREGFDHADRELAKALAQGPADSWRPLGLARSSSAFVLGPVPSRPNVALRPNKNSPSV